MTSRCRTRKRKRLFVKVFLSSFLLSACGGGSNDTPDTTPTPLTPSQPAPSLILPTINNVNLANASAEQYGLFTMTIDLSAQFDNPLDQREVDLNVTFTSQSTQSMVVAGFWNEQNQWEVRFSPPTPGEWEYSAVVSDEAGTSLPMQGRLSVNASTKKGMVKIGSDVNPDYSARYLAHQNGEPFYGIGHGDVFSIFQNSNPQRDAQRLVARMNEAGENYVLWWPQFYFSVVEDNYNSYSLQNVALIDTVVNTLEQENKVIVFTIWDHSQLRDAIHPWAFGNWDFTNGFSQLTSATNFFTDAEAWAWQQNLYRYMIARWGHSNAIGMWQTVSEVNGTNAFDNTNAWHQQINNYFKNNDPYQHITTASMAGDLTWDVGHAVMDMPQVHIYDDIVDPNDRTIGLTIESAQVIADYTANMWALEAKPNWIGEFGVIESTVSYYPELFHNSIWAALAAGAAMTPAEWNDFDNWGVMTEEMIAHMRYLSDFIKQIELVKLNPSPILVNSTNPNIRGWALGGQNGGLLWIQDTSLEGQAIDIIRQRQSTMGTSTIELVGMPAGQYTFTPFNTWQGEYAQPFTVNCQGTQQEHCVFTLPEFMSDIAIKIERVAE